MNHYDSGPTFNSTTSGQKPGLPGNHSLVYNLYLANAVVLYV